MPHEIFVIACSGYSRSLLSAVAADINAAAAAHAYSADAARAASTFVDPVSTTHAAGAGGRIMIFVGVLVAMCDRPTAVTREETWTIWLVATELGVQSRKGHFATSSRDVVEAARDLGEVERG